MAEKQLVLGIWDGHDAGAALLAGDRILVAVNEERLSRRKLDVGFPRLAIRACLEDAGLAPGQIRTVAASTTDPAKTLTRLLPGLKEEYYLIRRRKKAPRRNDFLKKAFKYRFTELPPNLLSRWLSRRHLRQELQALGFRDFRLELVDHHSAHAAAAAACCGFPEALVWTLDGVGDGLSGSLWRWERGALTPVRTWPARTSLGVFFEHVTNLLNMRELEDEGKVMALADFAYPVPDGENPLLDVIGTRGLDIVSPYSSTEMFRVLRRILWRYPSEQFACMAQRVLEKSGVALAEAALRHTGLKRLAVAGGVFSNIKLNMRLADLAGLERLFVFPHMGDGGLAVGAAIAANGAFPRLPACRLSDLYVGPAARTAEVPGETTLPGGDASGASPQRDGGGPQSPAIERLPQSGEWRVSGPADAPALAARLILGGEIVLWCEGRMEWGPRALGHRSILARPDDRAIKDRLNLLLKKRVWYQPFCPSMLVEDGPALLETHGQAIEDNRFMTTGFRVRPEHLRLMEGVVNVDGTCRPHFVGDEAPRYRSLLLHLKGALGFGVVLNTSANLHGEPMIGSPTEAVELLRRTGIRYLFMEDRLIEHVPAAIP